MRWKKTTLALLEVCVFFAFAGILIAVLVIHASETNDPRMILFSILLCISLLLFVGAFVSLLLHKLGLLKPAAAETIEKICVFPASLLMLGTLCVASWPGIVSILFGVFFLVCLFGMLGAFGLLKDASKRKAKPCKAAQTKPAAAPQRPASPKSTLYLRVEPDGEQLRLRYHGELLRDDKTDRGKPESVSGEATIPRDFFASRLYGLYYGLWQYYCDVEGAIWNLLPLSDYRGIEEYLITDPTGEEIKLSSFVPYIYLLPERFHGIRLDDESALMVTECEAQVSRYSVGRHEGQLFLHRHTDVTGEDAYYRLPKAFFFRDSEETIRTELRNWASWADVSLYAALRKEEDVTIRYSQDFSAVVSKFGYVQPDPLLQKSAPKDLRCYHSPQLSDEQPIMITKQDEEYQPELYNVYSVGTANGRLCLRRFGDQNDGYYDQINNEGSIVNRAYLLSENFFHCPEEAVREQLIQYAVEIESYLNKSRNIQSTVRFPRNLADIAAHYRELVASLQK